MKVIYNYKMFKLFITGLSIILSHSTSQAKTHIVELSKTVAVEVGDTLKTKDGAYTAVIKMSKASDCAVPGFNCGAGYRPSAAYVEESCIGKKCIGKGRVYFFAGKLVFSLENEQSCLERDFNESCFYALSEGVKKATDCNNFNSPTGKYICLSKFPLSNHEQFRSLCDQLPKSLRWNCYYEWAQKYKDSGFCEKYPPKEFNGRNRCYLKLAELLRSKALCEKIIKRKEDSYHEQCHQLF